MTETTSRKVPLAPDPRTLDERAARAWTERMAVTPLGGGVYRVDTHDDHGYSVDLPGQRCTCPDYRYRGTRCKHLRRVAIEITRNLVPPPGKREADCVACHTDAFVPETTDPPLCDDCRLEPGDIVLDRESGEGDRLVVQRVTPDRADEYVIDSVGQTVAEYDTNAAYPGEDPVVEVAYLPAVIRQADPRVYAFPYSRLEATGDAALID